MLVDEAIHFARVESDAVSLFNYVGIGGRFIKALLFAFTVAVVSYLEFVAQVNSLLSLEILHVLALTNTSVELGSEVCSADGA